MMDVEEMPPESIQLSCHKAGGWARTIRLSDVKFQWIRDKHLCLKTKACVRKIECGMEDNSVLHTGSLCLAPISKEMIDSKICGRDGWVVASHADIAKVQGKPFEEKCQWFQDTCAQPCVELNEGHVHVNVSRAFLLQDSVDAAMSLSRKDFCKLWRFEFIGEMNVEAGGLTRDWFQLVSEDMFDPDMGLWQFSEANRNLMQMIPTSEFCCKDKLVHCRFLDRVMGKALFDRQLCSSHMTPHMHKHVLGWPVAFEDLKFVDKEHCTSLKQLETVKSGEDLSKLCLDFMTTTEVLGKTKEIELIPGGADVELNNDNFPEHLEACLKHKLLDNIKPQLFELLFGFYDVVPEPLFAVFDFEELELLMCGQPEIDMDQWKTRAEHKWRAPWKS